jgi:transcriptional regulator with XRE-family HTH domain
MAEHPDPVDIHVGRRLKLRRALVGMSQERLAELLGITFQQVQKYERGANRIGSSRLYEISRILDVAVGWFFDEMAATKPAAPGLAEDEGQGFLFDGPMAADADLAMSFSRESLEMMRAFNGIGDAAVRRRLYELARALSQLRYRDAADEDAPA